MLGILTNISRIRGSKKIKHFEKEHVRKNFIEKLPTQFLSLSLSFSLAHVMPTRRQGMLE